MRLLNTVTKELEEFPDSHGLPYAILSYTWAADECSFRELIVPLAQRDAAVLDKAGYAKIEACCKHAQQAGYHYVWIDTCCIDKTSSAELSEAINSMFRYYEKSAVCYAHLCDMTGAAAHENKTSDTFERAFAACHWFTRGWTLQELIAPSNVEFVASDWQYIGSKADSPLLQQLVSITGIDEEILIKKIRLDDISVARRMSWAAERSTTRLEDVAYCLLGIFDINMPLLYGEGKKAFRRLQTEIVLSSIDQSLFAWGIGKPLPAQVSEFTFLAQSPSDFKDMQDLVYLPPDNYEEPPAFTSQGIRMSLPLGRVETDTNQNSWDYAVLNCTVHNEPLSRVAIPLVRIGPKHYRRSPHRGPFKLSWTRLDNAPRPPTNPETIYLVQDTQSVLMDTRQRTSTFCIRLKCFEHQGLDLVQVYPPFHYDRLEDVFYFDRHDTNWRRIALRFSPTDSSLPSLVVVLHDSQWLLGHVDRAKPMHEDTRLNRFTLSVIPDLPRASEQWQSLAEYVLTSRCIQPVARLPHSRHNGFVGVMTKHLGGTEVCVLDVWLDDSSIHSYNHGLHSADRQIVERAFDVADRGSPATSTSSLFGGKSIGGNTSDSE